MSRPLDDVLVVGGGLSALSVLLSLPRGLRVRLLTPPGASPASSWARGGIAVALDAEDVELHLADTLQAGAGLVDQAVARAIIAEGPDALAWLTTLGVSFSDDCALEAGHRRARVRHAAGDRTGAAIMRAVARHARAFDRLVGRLAWVARDDNGVVGAWIDPGSGDLELHRARHVVLATGGAGGLFADHTCPRTNVGVGVAAAAWAGARLVDLEFVQFHPTAIATPSSPLPLATEALRGAGARLVDDTGERICEDLAMGELTTRDALARHIATWPRPVYLDARHLGLRLARDFPSFVRAARRLGLDPGAELVPVRPAAHYTMGGVATDAWGRTGVRGLWAVGECAATGLHGANRLASNSLLEAVVMGRRVARAIAEDDPPRRRHARAWTGARRCDPRARTRRPRTRAPAARHTPSHGSGPGRHLAPHGDATRCTGATWHRRCARSSGRCRRGPVLRGRRAGRRCSATGVPLVTSAVSTRLVERLVELALDEDLGVSGDLTGALLPDRCVRLDLVARDDGILAGSALIDDVLRAATRRLGTGEYEVVLERRDGARLRPGTVVAHLAGSARLLLAAERTLLNFLCHLSGVATATAAAVRELAGTAAILRDTRKTTPGLRDLEKAAVVAGGGHNHRLRLDDAILVKDNHLACAPMATLVERARTRYPRLPIEVEVDTLDQLDEALSLGVELVLLDNFTLDDLRRAVAHTRGRAKLEASGRLRPGQLRPVALTGVDFLAVGWITPSAPQLDLGLDWDASR